MPLTRIFRKRLIWGAILLLSVACCYLGREKLLKRYLQLCAYRVTSGPRESDRVEINLLAPDPFDGKVQEGFTIKAYGGSFVPIVQTRTITGDFAKNLTMLWRNQDFAREHSGLCHDGVYGLRFYSGDTLRFETSVCFHCNNFYVPLPFLGAILWGFDSRNEQGQALWRELNTVVPYELRAPAEAEFRAAKQKWRDDRDAEQAARASQTSGQKP